MQLGEHSWKKASALTDKIVVVPLGSMEQHGHHLPLLTDSMIGGEIVARAHAELKDEALFLPMLWLGCSPHHLEFAGTVSVSSGVYISMIEQIAESLIGGGFRRILFFNAHAGNSTPTSVAMSNVQLRRATELPDLWMLSASWFSLAGGAIRKLEGFEQTKISHACEWETSQIMAIRPDLVGDERPAARFSLEVEGTGEPSKFFCADFSSGSRVEVARRIDQSTPTGALGWPELATPEKGERLYDAAAQELVALVREFAQWPNQADVKVSDGASTDNAQSAQKSGE